MSIYRRDLVDFTGILYVLPSVECLFGQLIGLWTMIFFSNIWDNILMIYLSKISLWYIH